MDGIWLPGIAKVSRLVSPPKTKRRHPKNPHGFFGGTKTSLFEHSPGASPERPNFREQMNPGRDPKSGGGRPSVGSTYHLTPTGTQGCQDAG